MERVASSACKSNSPQDIRPFRHCGIQWKDLCAPRVTPRKFKRHLCAQRLRLSTVSFYSFVFLSDTGNFVTATAYCGEFNDHWRAGATALTTAEPPAAVLVHQWHVTQWQKPTTFLVLLCILFIIQVYIHMLYHYENCFDPTDTWEDGGAPQGPTGHTPRTSDLEYRIQAHQLPKPFTVHPTLELPSCLTIAWGLTFHTAAKEAFMSLRSVL